MIVLDTHAWLWAYENDDRLSPAAREAIAKVDAIGVAAISLWEVAILERRGRIRLHRPLLAWLKEATNYPKLRVLPITPEIAAESVALTLPHGDPADRLIVATAKVHGFPVVTKDGKIAESGLIECLW